jgi:hypothetical protein
MITSNLASKFAADWYARPESERDQTRLAYLLSVLLQSVDTEATQLERERIQKKLAEMIR